MSDELKLSISIGGTLSNNVRVPPTSYHATIDVAGDVAMKCQQSVATSEVELTQGTSLGTPGYIMIKNLDTSNYVEVGSTTGVYDIKLLAGDIAVWRHNSATIYAKANTAAVLVEYVLVEL